jgi:hypothetical protein
MTSSWTAHPLLASPDHSAAPRSDTRRPAGTAGGASRSVRAGPCRSGGARASAGTNGRRASISAAGMMQVGGSDCGREDHEA